MLTPKQEKFVQSLVKGQSQYEAYKSAYSTKNMKRSTIDNNAYMLMQKSEILARYNELIERAAKKAEIKAEDIIKELAAIAFTDRTKISQNVRNKLVEVNENGNKREYFEDNVIFAQTDELDENTRKVIAGYKKTQSGFAVETYDKLKALELLGKYYGLFKDAAPVINNNINPYGNLSEEELRKLADDS